MRISETVGLIGIFIGIALPVIGTIRSFLKSIHDGTTAPKITRVSLVLYMAIIFFAGVAITLFLAINRSTNSANVLDPLIGTLTALIGIFYLIYQTRQKKHSAQTEAQTKNEQDRESVFLNVDKYLEKVKVDPTLTGLQILSMNYPLNTAAIYVDVQVYISDSIQKDKDKTQGLKPEEAIYKYKSCMIKGDPGSGKTTLLKDLSLKLLTKQAPELQFLEVPIYIELHAFARSGSEDLLEFISAKWDNSYRFPRDQAQIYFEEQLKKGKALLLLDGLDETFIGTTMDEARASCHRVVNAITQVKRLADGTDSCIVVTVRSALHKEMTVFDDFANEFMALELRGFLAEDIKKFVNNWFNDQRFNSQRHIQASDLNAMLSTNKSIQTLAANPLLLSLIAIVYEANLSLPNRRAELYHQCVETLLKRWDATRAIHRYSKLTSNEQRLLLEEVAWFFHEKGDTHFPTESLLTVVESFLQRKGLVVDSALAINEIASERGLLVEHSHDEYMFLHLTLQEYFVAQYALRNQKLDALMRHRRDLRWQEVILLYAAYASDSSPLLQKLLDAKTDHLEEELFHTSLILAGRCLAQSATPQPAHRERITALLLGVLKETPYVLTCEQAATALVEIGGSDIHRALLEILSNEQGNSSICQCIANAFKKLGDRSVVDDLLKLLSNEQISRPVRISLVKTLGSLGSLVEPSVAMQMVSLLSDEQLDVTVRASIAQALGSLQTVHIAPALLPLLAKEELDVNIRVRVADALGKLGDSAIIPDLMGLLSDESLDLRVRKSIAQGLGNLQNNSVVPTLLKLLPRKDLDAHLRVSIADAIGTIEASAKLEESTLVPELIRLSSDATLDENVRVSIVQALGTLNDPRIAPALAQLLVQGELSANICYNIAYALGRSKDHSVTQSLVDLLANKLLDVNVRGYIAQTLGDLQDKRVAPQLVQLLANKELDTNIRENIAVTLGKLGEDTVALELVQLLANNELDANKELDLKLRASIARALGVLYTTASAPSAIIRRLKQLLSREPLNTNLRANILVTLGRLRDDSVSSELVQLLENEQIDVKARVDVAHVLSNSGKPSVAAQLVNLLKRKNLNSFVSLQIVQTIDTIIERIKDYSVVSDLVDLLSESSSKPDDSVLLSIVSTPAAFDEPETVSLEQLLCDPQLDSSVRKEIDEALGVLGKEKDFSKSIQLFSSREQILRIAVVNVISKFASDSKVAAKLATLLKKNSDIPDSVHETIWKVTQRANSKAQVEE